MLEVVFFNIHDITLITVIIECILIGTILVFVKRGSRASNLLLGGFLFVTAGYAVDTLTYWNIKINESIADISLNWFFVFGLCSLLRGPLLLWYTTAVIQRKFRLKKIQYLHLFPALIYPLYMYAIFYRFDDDYKLAIVSDYEILIENVYFIVLRVAQDICVSFYAIYALYRLVSHERNLKATYASYRAEEYRWLRILIGGALFIWIWVVLSYTQMWFTDFHFQFGTSSNYFLFALINSLLVYGLIKSSAVNVVPAQYAINQLDQIETVPVSSLDSLINKMEVDQLYKKKNMTLESLADDLDISEKELSKLINGHFQKNFFEFVSYYRVEEAKNLLKSDQSMSVQNVMDLSGFRSKSAFNRCFMKLVSMTPSEYRKQFKFQD